MTPSSGSMVTYGYNAAGALTGEYQLAERDDCARRRPASKYGYSA